MDLVSSNINYMSETINDFRNFLNPNRKIITFSPQKSLEEVLTILDAQLKCNEVIYSLVSDCNLDFCGVENEFKQVMFILINNAIDAIKLKIQENIIKKGEISIKLSCLDDKGILEISDNGGGIDDKIIESIFDPYVTTKSQSHSHGMGIGLYIAKNIIESRMKGSLSVENIQAGSCFRIYLALK